MSKEPKKLTFWKILGMLIVSFVAYWLTIIIFWIISMVTVGIFGLDPRIVIDIIFRTTGT